MALSNTNDSNKFPYEVTTEVMDERAMIEHAFKSIRSFKKLGFIKPEDKLDSTLLTYDPSKDVLKYQETFYLSTGYKYLSFSSLLNYSKEDYENYVQSLENLRRLSHESMEIEIGNNEDASFTTLLSLDGNELYHIDFLKEGFSNDVVDAVGLSLKPVEEGVFERFYDTLLKDMDKIKFPTMDKGYEVKSIISKWKTDHIGPELIIEYENFQNKTFLYTIRDSDLVIDAYDEKSKFLLKNGTEVNLYVSAYKDDFLAYTWFDGIHFYEITIDTQKNQLKKEEIYKIIESSLQDKSTFSDLSLFKPLNNFPILTEKDKQLREIIQKEN